jgi:hypothetical protein
MCPAKPRAVSEVLPEDAQRDGVALVRPDTHRAHQVLLSRLDGRVGIEGLAEGRRLLPHRERQLIGG